MDFEEIIKKRASIREYSSKKPRIEDVIKCIENANLAPSPGNLPILKFIVVEDPKKIEKIAEATQQEFVKQAQILVVVCSSLKDAELAYGEFAETFVKQHTGAAIENFLLTITNLGLASCWVVVYIKDIVRDLLEIPKEIDIEAVLPVGYKLKTDKTIQRKKPSLENRIFFEKWKNKLRKPFPKIDV